MAELQSIGEMHGDCVRSVLLASATAKILHHAAQEHWSVARTAQHTPADRS